MGRTVTVESGTVGRVVYGRVRPNEDLVTAIETVCAEASLENGFVRASLGSLTDACLDRGDGRETVIRGPAVEVVGLTGEIRARADGRPEAVLNGMVAGPDGAVRGGRFVRGKNLVCVTFEVTIEEWLVDAPARSAQRRSR